MDTEMEDIHNIIDLSFHKGSECYGMGEEELEEGELIEGRPQIPNFKAFKLATFEAKDKADRLAKIEIWEESMKRETARKQCVRSVEGAACTRNFQAELPLVPSPLTQDSIYNNRQESVASETSGWTEEEREQAIHNGMYGDKYGDIYGDVYWDTNVDIHEENLVSENVSRTRRKKSNRSKRRKKAAELQASLQIYGLLPVPLPPQPLQEQTDRTVSQRDGAALRRESNNNQQEVREQEGSREMTMERTNPGAFTLQRERLEEIANLRERIMARKTLLQAQGLLPMSPSRQNVKENFIRNLPDGNPEADIFNPHNIQEKKNGQKILETMEIENTGFGASPQEKDLSQHITKSPITYRVRLREQRDKIRAQTQQSALDRQKSYGMVASPAHRTQNNPTIICRSYESGVATPLQQEKNTAVERAREPSTSIPAEIRVLLQREKERRQRLSALDNIELVEKKKGEQEQEILVPEQIRLSIKSTKLGSVPAKICAVLEKRSLEIVKKRAVLPDQGSSLQTQSTPQKPWQDNSSVIGNGSREVSQLEREQGHRATEGAGDGELLPALKDDGFLPENLDMEIDTVIEYRDKGDITKTVSIPQNIIDISDDARWHGAKIGEVMQETPLRSGAMVEDTSKDIWPRSIPEVLSQLFFLSEEVEEIIKMENEWFGWLGTDTDIDTDIEDSINAMTSSPNSTIEYPPEPEDTRATSDILSELFNISENIEDVINMENVWLGWLGMDIDVEDFADGFARC
ncbi:uncharacterized protein EAE98_000506 [Botrytis deweyae]|uniref:DUF4378 domain-containing protein n=1 Tax=Botrytis deweyae TaxID=2478750 RepID=A0ABQ7J2W1_9HELO|nr:uncharacterized protein EAE98_000506 [Botrytis deweyae]KAF7940379.1 hypothetical protein EAE98_000506 [Botrytis deweyae]